MKKFFDWLSTWIPYLWSLIMVIIITAAGMGISIALISWVLDLVGVL